MQDDPNKTSILHSDSTLPTSTHQQHPSPTPKNVDPNTTTTNNIPLRLRLKHFTFAWYLCTMSTGGLALCLKLTPHQFRGLSTIALILFLLTLTLFTLFTCLTTLRFLLHPQHFRRAISSPSESPFFGAYLLSICVLLSCISLFPPRWPWLTSFSYVSFFMYTSASFLVSLGQYAILARRNTKAFTPVQFLPGFTIMLAGVLASIVAPTQSPQRAGVVVATGLVAQGAGFGLSCACVVFFLRGVLDNGFPPPKVRPALFIPVGALAYTVVAVVGLADGIPAQHGYFARHEAAREVCKVVALVAGLFMWGFAVWLCVFAIGANVLVVKEMRFALAWWAFVFPNGGLVIATSMIGRELECEPLLWVASAMTVGVVVMWIVAAVGCVRAVWRGDIVWPGKDEDKDL